jgi:malonyl-CoA/methylmalonyl-CoA synthetase
MTDLAARIDALGASNPGRPFLVTPEGRTISYGDLLAETQRFAAGLKSLGVAPGDRVTAQIEKSPEALFLYFGCLWLGAVYMPLNTGYTQAELAYFVGDAEPALYIHDRAATPPQGVRALTLAADGSGTLMTALPTQSHLPRADLTESAQAAMLYTSGTTGRPKGAMIPRRALATNAATLAQLWRFTAEDVLLHALPVFHVHGLFVATNTVVAAGASMRFHAKFDTDSVLADMPHASVLMGVPTFYTRLLQAPDVLRDATRTMRLFVSGSAPLLPETHEAFAAVTGHSILERYGMTETQINTSHPYEGPRSPGTVGVHLPGVEVRITVPETDQPVPQGETGMIEVRGENLFTGYWRNAEKTAADLRPDGWFITGDLGHFNADGQLVIVGRGKDLIISGGLNIYPKEIETEINALPGVIESAVIGVPHPDFGEAVVAVVVGTDMTEAEIKAGLTDRLARFKQPKAVFIADGLPRNTMGKVQKALLRDTYAQLFAG